MYIFRRLPYTAIFGGASALSHDQMMKLNGFSNNFFGWGGEDDDMANRYSIWHYAKLVIQFKAYIFAFGVLFWIICHQEHSQEGNVE